MALLSRFQTHFAILPPSRRVVPAIFRNITFDKSWHHELLSGMQRLRARVYGADGALQHGDITSDGRHKTSIDERCWHVLRLDHRGEVVACLRYLEETHAAGFDDLWVRHAALAHCPTLGQRFRHAVERTMEWTKRVPMGFGEVGGWAVAEHRRATMDSVRIVLATYALLGLLGGRAGVATATFRHDSAPMLQRIGLTPLRAGGEDLPPYYDNQYRCDMQVLQFDSRSPNPKYLASVHELGSVLADAPVICHEGSLAPVWQNREVGPLWRPSVDSWIPTGDAVNAALVL